MKKKLNKGFVLAETLIVTTFVAGVLIFLFIQFSTLSNNYNDSYKYNTVEGLYSLKNIRDYIISDSDFLTYIEENITSAQYIDITDCELFTDTKYCSLLFELENIKNIYITLNNFDKTIFEQDRESLKDFINKINSEGNETYRIIAQFNDDTLATIRFGD